MLPIRKDYSYCWTKENDIAEFCAALAVRIKASPEKIKLEGIDVERITLALLNIYKEWWSVHKSDLELQALLAIAAASRWLWEDEVERLQDILEMLDEVAEAHAIASFQMSVYQNEFTSNGLRIAIERALGANVQCIIIQPDYIEVTFANGNYGDGMFDGVLCLDLYYHTLYILNNTTAERQDFQGTDLPRTDAEVEESLASDLWKASRLSFQVLKPSEVRLMQQREQQQIINKRISHTSPMLPRSEPRSLELHSQEVGRPSDISRPSDILRLTDAASNDRILQQHLPHSNYAPSQQQTDFYNHYYDDDYGDDSQFINDSICYTRGKLTRIAQTKRPSEERILVERQNDMTGPSLGKRNSKPNTFEMSVNPGSVIQRPLSTEVPSQTEKSSLIKKTSDPTIISERPHETRSVMERSNNIRRQLKSPLYDFTEGLRTSESRKPSGGFYHEVVDRSRAEPVLFYTARDGPRPEQSHH